MSKTNSSPIRLFNLEPDDFLKMYSGLAPEGLIALIIIAQPFRRPRLMYRLKDLTFALQQLADAAFGRQSGRNPVMRLQIKIVEDLSAVPRWTFRTDAHADWMVDHAGLVQVGFVNRHLLGTNRLPVNGVFKAGQIFDATVCRTKSVEAQDLIMCSPIRGCADEYIHDVGSIYRDGTAVLTRSLVKVRSALATIARGILANESYDHALSDALTEADSYHLLQVPTCPSERLPELIIHQPPVENLVSGSPSAVHARMHTVYVPVS